VRPWQFWPGAVRHAQSKRLRLGFASLIMVTGYDDCRSRVTAIAEQQVRRALRSASALPQALRAFHGIYVQSNLVDIFSHARGAYWSSGLGSTSLPEVRRMGERQTGCSQFHRETSRAGRLVGESS